MTIRPVSDAPFLAVQTETSDADRYAIERSIIEGAGGRLIVAQAGSEAERIELLREAQAVLVGQAQINRRVLEGSPRLQLIVRYGVGLDTLDIPAATEHGVVVAHYPDFCQPEVANHAIMLLLAVAKKLVVHDRAIRAGRWGSVERSPAPAIHGQTLGLISFGAIAREVAVRAQALGMTVTAYDPYEADATFEACGVARVESLAELLRGADHVSAHPPLTPETRGMMGAAQFALMKPEAIFPQHLARTGARRGGADRRPRGRGDCRRGPRCLRDGTAAGRLAAAGDGQRRADAALRLVLGSRVPADEGARRQHGGVGDERPLALGVRRAAESTRRHAARAARVDRAGREASRVRVVS